MTAEMLRDTAQAMNADSLWVVDHFLSLYHPDLWRQSALGALQPEADGYFDPFCVCAALGPTTDLPLGIGVTDATRRAAPDVARAALTLQHMCAREASIWESDRAKPRTSCPLATPLIVLSPSWKRS